MLLWVEKPAVDTDTVDESWSTFSWSLLTSTSNEMVSLEQIAVVLIASDSFANDMSPKADRHFSAYYCLNCILPDDSCCWLSPAQHQGYLKAKLTHNETMLTDHHLTPLLWPVLCRAISFVVALHQADHFAIMLLYNPTWFILLQQWLWPMVMIPRKKVHSSQLTSLIRNQWYQG